MIKFFRNIRKSLIDQNKMGKYFKYAFGEIVLVVIGILIALQINNWNERRNNIEKVVNIFKDIQVDLLNDIRETDRFIELFQKKQDSLSLKIINDEYNSSNYLDTIDKDLVYVGFYDYPLVISEQSFLLLNENKNIIPAEYKYIINDLNSLYIEDKHFLNQELETLKLFTSNFQKKLYDKTWFKKYINDEIPSKKASEYFTSDAYKSQILQFRNILKIVKDYAWRIKHKAIQNYIILNEVTKPKKEMPKIVLNHLNGSLTMIGNYEGIFENKEGKRVEFINENGLLFWHDEKQIYLDKFLLSEIKKDSLQFVMWNPSSLKLLRNSQGQINGFNLYTKDKLFSVFKKVSND